MEDKRLTGRWTALFGQVLPYTEEIKRAVVVPSEIALSEIPGMELEYSYMKVIFKNLPGRDEPLWAFDGSWLYLRRPEGVWKTAIPLEQKGRMIVLFQTREPSSKLYGGTQIGRNLEISDGWKRRERLVEPWELDFPYGVNAEGIEIGPMLDKVLVQGEARLVIDAGSTFGDAPVSWSIDAQGLMAKAIDGRAVLFPIAKDFDLLSCAKSTELWLRFSVWADPWMEPVDAKVVLI